MINAFEAIAEPERGNRVASYEPVRHLITRPALSRGSLVRRCILSMLVLCSIVWLVAAIASAQDLPASSPDAAKRASGWWSPESATAPLLLVSLAELTHFEASDSIRASAGQPTTYRLTEPTDGSILSLSDFGSTLGARVAESRLLADPVSLPPASFLSLLQTRYAVWESSLADSRSLTNVNGVSVYPVFQVNYGGWHLPVILYIPPLRGSDAR